MGPVDAPAGGTSAAAGATDLLRGREKADRPWQGRRAAAGRPRLPGRRGPRPPEVGERIREDSDSSEEEDWNGVPCRHIDEPAGTHRPLEAEGRPHLRQDPGEALDIRPGADAGEERSAETRVPQCSRGRPGPGSEQVRLVCLLRLGRDDRLGVVVPGTHPGVHENPQRRPVRGIETPVVASDCRRRYAPRASRRAVATRPPSRETRHGAGRNAASGSGWAGLPKAPTCTASADERRLRRGGRFPLAGGRWPARPDVKRPARRSPAGGSGSSPTRGVPADAGAPTARSRSRRGRRGRVPVSRRLRRPGCRRSSR